MGNISLPIILILFQIILIILFGVFVRFEINPSAFNILQLWSPNNTNLTFSYLNLYNVKNDLFPVRTGFVDINIMIIVGFAFLMTFLKRYGYSSLTFNLILSALIIQWALLTQGWILELTNNTIFIKLKMLIKAEFAVVAVLVSFGAVLGKLNLLQLFLMSLIEVLLFQCNELVCIRVFKAVDNGYTMLSHVFGTYFGLMVALFTARPGDVQAQSYKELSVYHSDLFTMIGTLFLWIFWPSFNSALVEGEGYYRAIINTYLALAASAIVALAVSSLVQKNKRFTMIHIQNSTLAGGVAMGTAGNLVLWPWVSLLTGALAGAVAVLGYHFITPCCNQKLRIHDTRGIQNLHGIPGIIGAILAILISAFVDPRHYGVHIQEVFPYRVPGEGYQAEFQLAALAVTLGIAILGGIITGFVLRLPLWQQPKNAEIMDDWDYWVLPSDGYPIIPNSVNAPPIYKLPEQTTMIENNA